MIPLILYIASILGANLMLHTLGLVEIAPGLLVPAGVFMAGLSFSLRDLAHEALGPAPMIPAIFVGSALSALFAPGFAIASGIAFLLSEMADLGFYTPIRHQHGALAAVAVSNSIGLTVDSILFLQLAFGELSALPGQLIGKGLMTVAALVAMQIWRYTRVPAR